MTPEKNSQNTSKMHCCPLWFSHKSSTDGTVQKSMLGHRMRKHTMIRWYGERRKCLLIIGWVWGGPSPPQTPPNNEEGRPPPQTHTLNVVKVPTFCHWSPLYQRILDPSLTVSTQRSGEIKRVSFPVVSYDKLTPVYPKNCRALATIINVLTVTV